MEEFLLRNHCPIATDETSSPSVPEKAEKDSDKQSDNGVGFALRKDVINKTLIRGVRKFMTEAFERIQNEMDE